MSSQDAIVPVQAMVVDIPEEGAEKGYYCLQTETQKIVVLFTELQIGRVSLKSLDSIPESPGKKKLVQDPSILTCVPMDSKSSKAFLALGDHKGLSRNHASIKWNSSKGGWELFCTGKNGVFVNKVHYEPSSTTAIPLKSPCSLKIGPARMFFLLAK